jgi:DMSO/TMAO reductase YedYZ heme-binding membrane subunit
VLHTRASGSSIDVVTFVFGGAAFVLLWLMAITSNDLAVRSLGRWWKRVHRFGMHYVWAVFVYTFMGVAFAAPWYWLFVVVGFGGLALRVIARRRMPQHAPVGDRT